MVINLPDSDISLDQLEAVFRRFAIEDDVFSEGFIHGALIYVQPRDAQLPPATPTLSHAVDNYLEENSAQLLFADPSAGLPTLSEGPYFITENQFHQAWRLYEDNLEAFVSSSVPAARGNYA